MNEKVIFLKFSETMFRDLASMGRIGSDMSKIVFKKSLAESFPRIKAL